MAVIRFSRPSAPMQHHKIKTKYAIGFTSPIGLVIPDIQLKQSKSALITAEHYKERAMRLNNSSEHCADLSRVII